MTDAKKVPKKTQKSLLTEIQKKKGFLMDFLLGQNPKKEKEENSEREKKGNETKRKPGRAAVLRKLLIIKLLTFCKHQLSKK